MMRIASFAQETRLWTVAPHAARADASRDASREIPPVSHCRFRYCLLVVPIRFYACIYGVNSKYGPSGASSRGDELAGLS